MPSGNTSAPKRPPLPIPDEPVRQFVNSAFKLESGNFDDFFTNSGREDQIYRSAQGSVGSYHDELSVEILLAILEKKPDAGVEIYLDLAIAYLTFGQFDDAKRVLKDAKARPAGKLTGYIDVISEHTDRLIQTLTAGRDALLKDGIQVTYPDRRIFEQAWLIADPKDDYLRLNIVDACDSAFPDSLASTRWVIDANFNYLQAPSPNTNVPRLRGSNAFERAMTAADTFKDEKQQLYTAVRLTQFIIGRIDWDTGLVSRSDVHSLIIEALQLKAEPDVRAFLLYGNTLRSLKRGWESRGYINDLVKDMQEAVRLDGEQPEYAALLKQLQLNGHRIESQVIAARQRRTKVAVGPMFSADRAFSDADARRQRANQLGNALIIGSIGLLVVASIAGENGSQTQPTSETKPATVACPYCVGGLAHWSWDQCLHCNGTGRVTSY